MTPILSDDEIREIIPVAALAWWDSKGPTARDLRDMRVVRQVESAILEKVQAEREAMAAQLAECRTPLADVDRKCDRELLARIDAAINKEKQG